LGGTRGAGYDDSVQRDRRLRQLKLDRGGLTSSNGDGALTTRIPDQLCTNACRTGRYASESELSGRVCKRASRRAGHDDLHSAQRALTTRLYRPSSDSAGCLRIEAGIGQTEHTRQHCYQ
jgi:hypothetical protein